MAWSDEQVMISGTSAQDIDDIGKRPSFLPAAYDGVESIETDRGDETDIRHIEERKQKVEDCLDKS